MLVSFYLLLLTILGGGVKGYDYDPCLRSNTEKGICIPIITCPFAIDRLRQRIPPDKYGFGKDGPLVCCPLEGIKSKRKCEKYYRRPKEQIGFGAVGGEPALSKEFPFMAALGFQDGNITEWLCGGTLISEQFVLTAAHCLVHRDYGTVKTVRLGDLDLESTTDEAQPVDFGISATFRHPGYIRPSRYNDIALIKLEKTVNFNDYIKPACLEYRTLGNLGLTATGWGKTSFGGDSSPQLMKVDLQDVQHNDCQQTYNEIVSKKFLPYGIWRETQICAGGDGEVKDTCQGDSGGPLLVPHEYYGDVKSIYGITSFGYGCGLNVPGVYTRVSYYIQWIEDTVWADENVYNI